MTNGIRRLIDHWFTLSRHREIMIDSWIFPMIVKAVNFRLIISENPDGSRRDFSNVNQRIARGCMLQLYFTA